MDKVKSIVGKLVAASPFIVGVIVGYLGRSVIGLVVKIVTGVVSAL